MLYSWQLPLGFNIEKPAWLRNKAEMSPSARKRPRCRMNWSDRYFKLLPLLPTGRSSDIQWGFKWYQRFIPVCKWVVTVITSVGNGIGLSHLEIDLKVCSFVAVLYLSILRSACSSGKAAWLTAVGPVAWHPITIFNPYPIHLHPIPILYPFWGD